MKKDKMPNLHERDGKLYVRIYYQKAGKWTSKEKRVNSKREASKVIADLRHKVAESGHAIFDGERMTFDQLVIEYEKAHPGQKPWYLDPIKDFFKGRRIRSISYGDLKKFKTARENVKNRWTDEDRKPSTIHREIEKLREVILLAFRHGWLLRNPFLAGPALIVKSEEERRDRLPTPEEEVKILAVCVPPRGHLRGLIIATRDTGLRKSALQALTWSCVDFENSLLRVPSGNRYKKRPKTIGMTARLQTELFALWTESDQQPETKIFKPIKEFRRSYATACRLAGIEGLRFNDWRHGFATDLMEAGLPQHFAMKLAGHTTTEIHDIYTNVDERLARQAAEALNKLHRQRQGNEITDGTALVS